MKAKQKVYAYDVFSLPTRIFHWVMAVCICLLFGSGLYIGDPFFAALPGLEPTYAVDRLFSMETIRYLHFAAGYLLFASFILRIYGFLRYPGDRLLPRFWERAYYESLLDTQLHYMFLRLKHKPYLRNSLARSGYAALYAMLVFEAVTGFAMYAMIRPEGVAAKIFGPVNHWFVDEYIVHLLHHYVAWCIMLFVIVHVYMVIRADMLEKGGEISSMISGRKYYEEEPVDSRDLER